MRRADSLVVPATFLVGLLAVLAVTVSWVPRPPQLTPMVVKLGPPGMVPGHRYGLSFTPRNPLSGHILTRMVPSQPRCVPVTFTDDSLTYIDETTACRTPRGSYKVIYTFPRPDDYVIFIELHPLGGQYEAVRLTRRLDLCALRRHGICAARPAQLRGLEAVRSHTVRDLVVVLGAPARAVNAHEQVAISFVFLRRGRAAPDLQPIGAAPGQAVAISMNTRYFVRLYPDPGQVAHGRVKAGAVSFTAWFDRPSIYRVFGRFRYRNRPLRTSFVIDVNPAPTPTPVGD